MWLYAKEIEICNEGQWSGTIYNLAKEGINLKASPRIIDVIKSTSHQPYQKIDVGGNLELSAVLEGALLVPDSRDNSLIILDRQNIRFSVRELSVERQFMLENCIIVQDWDLAFKGKSEDITYLPLKVKSMDDTTLQILDEVSIYGYDPGMVPEEFEILTETGEPITGYVPAT